MFLNLMVNTVIKECFKVPFPLRETSSVSKMAVRALILFLDVSLFEWSRFLYSDYSESHENEYAKVYIPGSLGIFKLPVHVI